MKLFLRKKLLIAAIVPAIGMPLATSSFAQSTTKQGAGQQQSQAQGQQGGQQQDQQAKKIRDMRATDIMGAKVQSPKGEDLGDVQDLIVNTQDGRVNYAIVAFGGTLGFGEKLFAYPMDRLKAGTSGDELILNASEQEMKNAPGFDRSTWPTFGMGGYRGEVDKHFGKTAKAGGNLVRMSEMLDNKVVDRIGNSVGEIDDVVVSLTDGKVRYVALEPDKELNMGDKLVMLPMNAIRATSEQQFKSRQQAQQRQPGQPQQSAQTGSQAQPQGEPRTQQQQARQQEQQQQAQREDRDLQLVLTVEPKQLQQARTVQKDQWPDVNSQAFQRQMDSYVASFPSGGQKASTSGASGGQGQTGSTASQSGAQQNPRSKNPPAQERERQREPGTAGQSR